MIESYVELVRRRLEDRSANIIANMEKLGEDQLRFTMRIFGDCLDEGARKALLSGYTEYRTEKELRSFAMGFVPAYTEYAIAELLDKKKEGERFFPPYLTQEEYQEMAVREKWPKIEGHLEDVPPLQLCREMARMAMLFRPYMLSDPGFNEGVLEFALYFDLLDRLAKVSLEHLRAAAREIAPLVERAAGEKSIPELEAVLARIRGAAAKVAGLPVDPERLLGPEMERVPREAPPEWKLRELRMTLETMSLKDLRLSALVHIDVLTTEEVREIVSPFMTRFPSFYEIPGNALRELILAVAESVTDRLITYFFDRYSTGRMAMTKPVSFLVWKLMPEEEKLRLLRQDNEPMDSAMMARHLARFLHSASPVDLGDAGRQIVLLTDQTFITNSGSILKNLGEEGKGDGVRVLYDEVTAMVLRMMSCGPGGRQEIFEAIRGKIAEAAGVPLETTEGGM
jgi:hemolysin-activating ACP:hemolysin acyltransferase